MAFLHHWLATVLLLVPLGGAGAALCVRGGRAIRWTALGTMLMAFVLALLLLLPSMWRHPQAGGPPHISQPGAAVPHVAADGLSVPFLLLTVFLFPLACAASWEMDRRPRAYFAALLLLEFTLLGTFLSFDLRLFYLFIALSVFTSCALVAWWGGLRGMQAAIRMLLYLLVSLGCLLAMVIGVYWASRQVFAGGTFDLAQLAGPQMRRLFASGAWQSTGRALFILATVGFLARLAVVPLHAWLADVLSETPAPVGMLIVALIPATGGYGLLRVAAPLFPHAAASLWMVFAILGLASILYGGLCTIAQDQLRRVVGYATVSLYGFVLLGVSMRTAAAADGAVFLLVSNGLIAALLLMLDCPTMPRDAIPGHEPKAQLPSSLWSALFAMGWLAWLAVPGLLSQMIVLIGTFQSARPDSPLRAAGLAAPGQIYAIAAGACAGAVLSGAWAARAAYRVFAMPGFSGAMTALGRREAGIMGLLAAAAILLGIFPEPLCLTFTHHALIALFHGAH